MFECFVFLSIIASQTYTAVAPSKEKCWWTGCQASTWAVTGCNQYNRTEENIRVCDGGSEYYCCLPDLEVQPVEDCWWTGCQPNNWAVKGCDSYNRTERERMACEVDCFKYECCKARDTSEPDENRVPGNVSFGVSTERPEQSQVSDEQSSNWFARLSRQQSVPANSDVREALPSMSMGEEKCWWTGCQASTWAVTGCNQYNRTEENVRVCDGGSEYYCCLPDLDVQPAEDCWWTGCQASTWAVTGCNQYNRTVENVRVCDGGSEYYCCLPDLDVQPAEDCWWSGCQPKNRSGRGCPTNTVRIGLQACSGGDLFQCCPKSIPVDGNGTNEADKYDVEEISGTSFTDYVRYLLLKGNNFTIKPDKLRCDLIDVEKSHMFRVKNEGIRVCDLCPNFPQQHYQNVYLDSDPTDVRENFDFPDCFGLCFETSNCVAFSYDHASKKCYIFASTDGNLEEEYRWTTVFMTQPAGVLYDWMYSRHTLAAGAVYMSRTQETTFLACLDKCNSRRECNVISYSLTNSTCTTYRDIENQLQRVDFEYGYVSAFRMEVLPMGNGKKWRFYEMGDGNLLSLKPMKISNDKCALMKNDTHNSFYSKPCFTSPSQGCNVKTGCKTCYYPEKVNGTENLSVCPDSDLYYLERIEKLVDSEMSRCLNNSECMGFGLNSELAETITIANFGQRPYFKSFMLKYPEKSTVGIHKYLKNYEFIENLEINPLPNSTSTIQILREVTFDKCLSDYEKSNFKRMSYSVIERKCSMSSEFVQLIENKNFLTMFKKPSFLSPTLNYIRTPGLRLDSKLSVNKIDCKTNCEETCAKICNQASNEWCAYVYLEYFIDSSRCHFFNVSQETSLKMEPSTNSMILVAQSKSNFTLAAFDQVNPFSQDENMILGCFSSTNEQTQTSLTVFGNPSGTTEVAKRHKRGFFDWIGKAVKSVANTVVNAVKDTVKGVVDTAKGVVKAVDKVVKGDLKGAKNAITNIPIVKDIKNAVEFGGAVITGDWDSAKEKGINLLGSSLVDVGLTVIAPGVGKIIGTGLKSIAKGSKTAVKNMKKQSDKVKHTIKPKQNNNINKENKNGKVKPKDKDKKKEDVDRCESRRTRTTSSQKGKHSCKRAECDAPKSVRFSLTESFESCNKKQVGSKCHYECKVGYEEKGPSATCTKKTNQMTVWDPQPECSLYKCSDTMFPIVAVKTPKIESLTSIPTSKYIVVYVVMFDKSRKIPVWSVALHQSNQFQSKSYNDAKDVGRKSFFRYPCTALLQHQAVGSDYSNSGWDQGHLTPANIARWSEKASKSTFSFINIAPQVPYINEHPWQKLEFHVECFSTRRRTLVVTGVCKDSLGLKIGKKKIDVPKCFWKMLCYKDEKSKEQVVGFIGDNSLIKPGTIADREKDIFTARSQSEIEKLYDSTLGNPWVKSIEVTAGREVGINPGFDNDADSGTIWLPVNVFDCMNVKTINDYEKKEWEDKLLSKKRKQKRDISDRFSRGCTPSELDEKQELFDLIKKRQAAVVSDSGDDDDNDLEDDNVPPSSNVKVSVQNCGKRIIGYYTSWGLKKIRSNALAKLTHVIYAFLEMRADGTVDLGSPDIAHSPNVEEETAKSRSRLEHLMNLAKFYPHLKVMFAVGGWENSQYFSRIATSSESRVRFIASIVKLIEKFGFDGVDIDWEYPVTGGAVEGVLQDKTNYVLLMKDLRQALDVFAADAGRKNKFLISFAGAAGQWTLDPGFDLPGLLQYADFVNVMTYDFFGAWSSKWGAYTGPPAPLYFGMPPRFSGKTNVDWTIKYYTCKSKLPHKINMGIPFYGRFWNNVGDSVDGKDQMWRTANAVNGVFQGGYTPWFKIKEDHLSDQRFKQSFHEKSKSPYAWNEATKVFLGYENKKSLEYKVKYAAEKNVGGLMIWSVDLDDDDLTLLNTVYTAPLCDKTNPNDVNHKCSPIDEKRWWTSEDGDDFAGLCGRSAPLYKGYYPVCDPDDPGYSCCGPSGYCGSGDKYCDCPTCKDFGNNPKIILDEPIKPTVPVSWYFLDAKEGLRGRCGRKIPKINGVFPTCNPDDENAYCCSNGNYCGKGADFCDCQGCVNFKTKPLYRFGPKKWWTLEDGNKRAGTCGVKADKVDGKYEAECEPNTKFNCCSPNGYCGSGADYCDCKGCKRF